MKGKTKISFQTYMNLQARFLQIKHIKTGLAFHILANKYAINLHNKLHSKYNIERQ